MARTSFGSGLGSGKIEPIGDNRYGVREMYDAEEMRKLSTIKVGELTVKESKSFNSDRQDCEEKWQSFLKFSTFDAQNN